MSTVLEQDFQQRFRTAVTAARLPVRLWRQPTGKLELAGGRGFVDAAPVGAADLTGLVLGTGTRIELELKGPKTKVTDEQLKWRAWAGGAGAVALQVRYDGGLLLEENIARAVDALRAAVDLAACAHPDEWLVAHPAGGVWCTRCGWRNGGRAREAPHG